MMEEQQERKVCALLIKRESQLLPPALVPVRAHAPMATPFEMIETPKQRPGAASAAGRVVQVVAVALDACTSAAPPEPPMPR